MRTGSGTMKTSTHSSFRKPETSASASETIKELEKSKWRVILELHKSQEMIEALKIINSDLQDEANELKRRIRSILEMNPDAREYEKVELSYNSEKLELGINIKNAYLSNRLFPELSLTVGEREGKPMLKVKNTTGQSLLSGSHENTSSNELIISPADGSPFLGPNALISALSTSDWESLLALLKILEMQDYENATAIPSYLKLATRERISHIVTRVHNWPAILRYDEIGCAEPVTQGSYSKLTLSIDNPSFGDFNWSSIEFSLATVSMYGRFDMHPRIELPKSTSESLDNWYIETSDHRGERLEIRYAHPQDFDTEVWGHLSHKDKHLLTALAYFMPTLVRKSFIPIDDAISKQWLVLAESVKRIHIDHIKNYGL